MKWIVLFVLYLSSIYSMATNSIIDDWDSNATQKVKKVVYHNKNGLGGNIAPVVMASAPMPVAMKKMVKRKIGLAVGGAKDSDNFIQNIKHGYLPKLKSITYEGVFYDHYFDVDTNTECKEIFCPTYSYTKTTDIYDDTKEEYYLSVGLTSGMDMNDFHRDKLNLVVVLDVSGSMGSAFDRYYYDHKASKTSHKTKMQIANETLVAMMSHLKPEDNFGVVLFDDLAYPVKPFRKVAYTDMKAIKKHILDIHSMGGTNWSAGYKEALKYFKKVSKKGYENRIIFITDAMPNQGELKKDRLFGMTKNAAKKGIHTTFIGVGVDFNANLVDYVSKIKGANYYSVHSSKEFAKRMDKEFEYMVTPLVYNLKLSIDSKNFKVAGIYGVPKAKLSTKNLIDIDTLFASDSSDEGNKGGVILLKLKKISKGDKLDINLNYKDRYNKKHYIKKQISINKDKSNSALHKAIVLTRYVTLMQNWLIDARAGCNDKLDYAQIPYDVIVQRCMIYPPLQPNYHHIKTWERRSCKLQVSDGYKKLFRYFRNYYKAQLNKLRDKSMKKELKVLDILLKDNLSIIDDYNDMR